MADSSVRDDLERLVAFDTTSQRASNRDLVAWIANRVERPGVRVWDLPDPAAPGDLPQHNLLVRLGPEAPGGWLLSAHTDCVPVTGQPWTSDPFEVLERDGRLHGRGTTDMKGFIAACLAGLDDVDLAALRRPIVLAFSHSEELGTLGAPALVDSMAQHLQDPELAIVGEPTMMQVIGAHKGVRGGWMTVRGVDAHSSQPDRGASAVTAAAPPVSPSGPSRMARTEATCSTPACRPWSVARVPSTMPTSPTNTSTSPNWMPPSRSCSNWLVTPLATERLRLPQQFPQGSPGQPG